MSIPKLPTIHPIPDGLPDTDILVSMDTTMMMNATCLSQSLSSDALKNGVEERTPVEIQNHQDCLLITSSHVGVCKVVPKGRLNT